MSGPKDWEGWQDGLRLDSAAGPAPPLDEAQAAQMIDRALEALPARQRPPGLQWSGAAAAAAVLLVGAPAAIGAFRAFVAPIIETTPPPAGRQHRAVETIEPKTPVAPLEPEAPMAPIEPDRPTAPIEPEAPMAPIVPDRPTAPALKAAESSPRPRRPRRAAPAPRPSADVLLARANDLRAHQDFAGAAAAYAEVRRAYPGTGSAYVAAVAEGQLYLEPLADADAALSAFRVARALIPDGPLAAEARFGEGAALVALGQPNAGRRVWAALVARYPDSAPAKRVAARLESSR